MDPVTAIGLASAILTFIDFAHKIVTGADELYQRGTIEEHAHTENIINDLDDAATDLATLPGQTKHEKALNRLAESCSEVSRELQQLLRKLTVSGKRIAWKALKTAVRNIRNESEVARLLARLDQYRGELLLRLSLMLNDQQCSIKRQLNRLEAEGLNLSNESAKQLKELHKDILSDIRRLSEKNNETAPTADYNAKPMKDPIEIKHSLDRLSSMMVTIPKENVILQSIFFSSMKARETGIDNAEDGTYRWIFEEENDPGNESQDEDSLYDEYERDDQPDDTSNETRSSHSDDTGEDTNPVSVNHIDSHNGDRSPSPAASHSASERSEKSRFDYESRFAEVHGEELQRRAMAREKFITWLRHGRGVFHITGKAGSGKSTFMKYICSHERTQEELRVWAGEEKKLVFARFYFWKSSNDKMQMTLPGLHRSILFETLKHCPDLIPNIFPKQWAILDSNAFYVKEDLITDSDAQNAFEALASKNSFPRHRFCFFIDGLDEYHGQFIQQLNLANDLERWTSGNDIKICASSRPYIEFDKLVTSDEQKFRLHELTRHDIYLFSSKMVHDHIEAAQKYHLRLIDEVIARSEGVFLWARLVVCSLLEGMLRHDEASVLEEKLCTIPTDIDGLYKELLGNLQSDDRLRAEEMLLITAHRPKFPYLGSVVYAFLDQLRDSNFPPLDGKRPPSWRSYGEYVDDVQLQLKSLTKGLLELRPISNSAADTRDQVEFSHRTVRDFVLEHYKSDALARFPWIGQRETHYRLWLAELVVTDVSLRGYVWDDTLPVWDDTLRPRSKEFDLKIPSNLIEGFSHSLHCINARTTTLPRDYCPKGCRAKDGFRAPVGKLSFVHYAAHEGHSDYVIQQVTKSPELLGHCDGCHILLSAALGEEVDVVRFLLRKGSRATDSIRCEIDPALSESKPLSVPLWCMFTMELVRSYVSPSWSGLIEIAPRRWEILELLLRDPGVCIGNPLVVFHGRIGAEKTYFASLSQVIQHACPPNADRLLAILGQKGGGILPIGARSLLSKMMLAFRQANSSLETQTCGYTQSDLGERGYVLEKMIFGNLVLPGSGAFRLY